MAGLIELGSDTATLPSREMISYMVGRPLGMAAGDVAVRSIVASADSTLRAAS